MNAHDSQRECRLNINHHLSIQYGGHNSIVRRLYDIAIPRPNHDDESLLLALDVFRCSGYQIQDDLKPRDCEHLEARRPDDQDPPPAPVPKGQKLDCPRPEGGVLVPGEPGRCHDPPPSSHAARGERQLADHADVVQHSAGGLGGVEELAPQEGQPERPALRNVLGPEAAPGDHRVHGVLHSQERQLDRLRGFLGFGKGVPHPVDFLADHRALLEGEPEELAGEDPIGFLVVGSGFAGGPVVRLVLGRCLRKSLQQLLLLMLLLFPGAPFEWRRHCCSDRSHRDGVSIVDVWKGCAGNGERSASTLASAKPYTGDVSSTVLQRRSATYGEFHL
mmetsp:Transcript_3694/g.9667  ORF Transcript_3694/g.9667 Transcript_3694/m.9667 type:complete len:333 (-) Transcript_3694:6-1004(-)